MMRIFYVFIHIHLFWYKYIYCKKHINGSFITITWKAHSEKAIIGIIFWWKLWFISKYTLWDKQNCVIKLVQNEIWSSNSSGKCNKLTKYLFI